MELDGNKLASDDLVCNAKYISPGRNQKTFMLIHIKTKTVTVPMNTVSIPNLEAKVWTQKSEFPQGTFLRYLTQPEITRQRPFELTDIYYDLLYN